MGGVRVGVVYGFPFGDGGGLDRAMAATLYALNRSGYKVELVTFGNPDLEAIRRLYGFDFEVTKVYGDRLFYSLPGLIRVPAATVIGLYHAIGLSKNTRLLIFAGGRFHPTRFIPYRKLKAICYMYSPRWKSTAGVLAEKGVSLPKKLFRIVWDSSWPSLLGPRKDDVIIAHNSYSRSVIEREFGISAKYVLSLPAPDHPMVKAKKINQVVSFGRFHPEKRHNEALRIMSRVKELAPDSKFVFMGLTNLPEISRRVLSELEAEVDRLGLTNSVGFVKDPSFEEVLQVLAASKVIMSMQLQPETYNMTIIESMSQGCVPVLPRVPGGAWEDILDEGKFGFGFGSEEEGAETIAKLLSLTDSEFHQLSTRSRQRSEFFSLDNFARKLDNIVREFLASGRQSKKSRINH